MVTDKPQTELAPGKALPEERIPKQRPFGVSILAGLTILLNFGLLFIAILRRDEILSVPPGQFPWLQLFPVYLVALLVVNLVIGWAFWMGKSWSWWVVVFYYLYRSSNVAISLISLNYDTTNYRMISDAIFDVLGILINLAIISYLSENHVLSFFSLHAERKRYYLSYTAIGAVIAAVLFALV